MGDVWSILASGRWGSLQNLRVISQDPLAPSRLIRHWTSTASPCPTPPVILCDFRGCIRTCPTRRVLGWRILEYSLAELATAGWLKEFVIEHNGDHEGDNAAIRGFNVGNAIRYSYSTAPSE